MKKIIITFCIFMALCAFQFSWSIEQGTKMMIETGWMDDLAQHDEILLVQDQPSRIPRAEPREGDASTPRDVGRPAPRREMGASKRDPQPNPKAEYQQRRQAPARPAMRAEPMQERLRQLEKLLQQTNERLNRFERRAGEVEERLQALKNFINQVEERLHDRFAEMDRPSPPRSEPMNHLEELREKLERQSTELKEREENMVRHSQEIDARFAELANIEKEWADRSRTLDERAASFEERENELQRWNEDLNQRAQKLEQQLDQSNQRAEEIHRIEQNLEERRYELDRREENLQQRSAELDERQRQLDQREQEFQRRKDELANFSNELLQRENQLEQRKDFTHVEEPRDSENDKDAAGLILGIILVILLILWIWCLQDCLKKSPADFPGGAYDKIVWTIVLLFTLGFGAVLYLFLVQGTRKPS